MLVKITKGNLGNGESIRGFWLADSVAETGVVHISWTGSHPQHLQSSKFLGTGCVQQLILRCVCQKEKPV
ncbi:hypothetical protein I79_017909 [Cricetulus griseus]|uniref:Uncharacterized protein n=1 Tax=Cricetulus griseus TaxID=10029 RepID=G3I3A7_CRIGR|nr:hypothetical protein I79_017909 [Cricetulus griseus]